jgi:hypothetical protein
MGRRRNKLNLQHMYVDIMPPMLKQLLHCNCHIHAAKFCSDYLTEYEVEEAPEKKNTHYLRRRTQQRDQLEQDGREATGAAAEVCEDWCKGCCAKANVCPLRHCLWVPEVVLEHWEASSYK